MRCLRALLV